MSSNKKLHKRSTCILCKSTKKDDLLYGEFLTNENMGVHTYCLYLSSNLQQNGADDEGFLGFLEADIRKEVYRNSQLNCFYCHKPSANIGCCHRKCRRNFHFICGLENYCQNKYSLDFRSYCHIHVRKVQQRPTTSETCLICFEIVWAPGKRFYATTMIQAPCCRNGWFHKLCLQKFSKTSGYFCKCPLCNDASIFREKISAKGIFIPNQDAAWELEPNAFEELLERPSECSAIQCRNKQGRKVNNDRNPFIMCSTCGSIAMHRLCLSNGDKQFHCSDCSIAIEQHDSGRESLNSQINQRNEMDDNDEEVDVCIVSDNEDLLLLRGLKGSKTNEEKQKIQNMNKKCVTGCSKDYKESNHNTYNDRPGNSNVKTWEDKQKINKNCATGCKDSNYNTYNDRPGHSRFHANVSESISEVEQEKKYSTLTFNFTESSSEEEEQEKYPELPANSLGNCVNSNSSEVSTNNRRKKRVISDSEDEHVLFKTKNLNVQETIARPRTLNSIGKFITIDSDTDDSDVVEVISSANTSILTNENDDDDDDDDPLENFTEIIERQNCAALSTRKEYEIVDKQDIKTNSRDLKYSTSTVTEEIKTPPNVTSSRKINDYYKPQTDKKDLNTDESNDKINIKASNNVTKTPDSDNECKNNQFKPLNNTSAYNSRHVLDVSCIAKRTRRKSIAGMRNNNALNVSCIAVRTRRRTVCAASAKEHFMQRQQINNKLHETNEDKDKQNLNISCIAVRTRRRTVCAASAKERFVERPQINIELHESNEDNKTDENGLVVSLSSDDNENYDFKDATESDISNSFGTPDEDSESYGDVTSNESDEPDNRKGKNINLELSCIANRTRKRKSLQHNLQSIDETDDTSSSSFGLNNSEISSWSHGISLKTSCSTSSSSSSLASEHSSSSSTYFLHNVDFKKRRYLCLSSAEDSQSATSLTSLKKKTISPSRYLEKLPQRNSSVFVNSKYISKSSLNSSSIYYPRNHYQPYCKNHRRV